MNTTSRMTSMIENAKVQALEKNSGYGFDTFGDLQACAMQKRNPNNLKMHWCVTWRLNSKRITSKTARSYLEK